jgi:hypothetical protein
MDRFAGSGDDFIDGVHQEVQHAPHLTEKPESQGAQLINECQQHDLHDINAD